MTEQVVIIGAGQAAAQCAASLRLEGFQGDITIIGEEAAPPYQRPPLSKAYLAGELDEERLYLKPRAFYDEQRIALWLGTRVDAIDRTIKRVRCADGREVPYTHLVIATGSRIRKLPIPGQDLPGVFYLRGAEDVDRLRGAFLKAKSLTILGGGYIGLEVAAVATKLGIAVTVIEMAERVLARVASPELSAFFEADHRSHGVSILTGARALAIRAMGAGLDTETDKVSHRSDIVLIAAGILPNVELAQGAGLAVENGIVVDEFARTGDPAIFAAGDCANLPCRYAQGRVRLESVQNAIDQAKHITLAIMGRPKPYQEVPWFWSDQYDLKLQIAGLGRADDLRVVRGHLAERSFAVFFLRQGVLMAVEAVNAAPEYMMGRRLIAQGARPDPKRLADKTVSMKEMG